MNTSGLIFSGTYNKGLALLTPNRTIASLPFGGRYRLIDFILSNMVNSGICNIGVTVQQNYQSLMEHLGSCHEWDLNRKGAALRFLPPGAWGKAGAFRGRIDEVYGALHFLEKVPGENVLLAETTSLCNLDLREAIASHEERGDDLTVIAKKCLSSEPEPRELVFSARAGKVEAIYFQYPAAIGQYQSIGMMIFKKKKLMELVREMQARGFGNLEKDLIQTLFNQKKLRVGLYDFEGTVLEISSPARYLECNRLLLDEKVSQDLFCRERPIYTNVRDEIPSYFAETSIVSASIVADGCRIGGEVTHSVIFRNVTVENGAKILHSSIGQDCVIGKNCLVENAILDKNITLRDGEKISGTAAFPAVIRKDTEG